MARIRWEPARELSTLQGEMNQLFNSFFDTGQGGGTGRRWVPAMDVAETEGHFVVRADLPGLTEEDVAIEVESNVLTISGERKLENREQNGGYYRAERAFGHFARTLTLPEGTDPEGISADFTNGVLEVRIPKPEQTKPRRVSIGVGGSGRAETLEGSETAANGAAA
jgi:HSP20 family protein